MCQRTQGRGDLNQFTFIPEHAFGVMQIHNVRWNLAKKGVGFDREVRIFEVCHPPRAKQALETDILISAVLP